MKTDELNTKIKPTWCPGCGNFGIFEALKRAIVNLKIPSSQVLVTYGIGCHGHMANFLKTNGFEGLHGRPLPLAIGAKLTNPNLTVLTSSGDGDAYSEGLNHLVAAARANHNITLLVHDNWAFSLTTGQSSPTSPLGKITKSMPRGTLETPLNPLKLALASGATFVSRGFATEVDHLSNLIAEAIKHEGFSLIDVLQPCVIFGKEFNPLWFKERIYKVEEKDLTDADRAYRLLSEENKLPIGLFYRVRKPTFWEEYGLKEPLVRKSLEKENIEGILENL